MTFLTGTTAICPKLHLPRWGCRCCPGWASSIFCKVNCGAEVGEELSMDLWAELRQLEEFLSLTPFKRTRCFYLGSCYICWEHHQKWQGLTKLALTPWGVSYLAMQWTFLHDTVNASNRRDLWPQGMKPCSWVMATVPGSGPGLGFPDAGWNIILDLTQIKLSEMSVFKRHCLWELVSGDPCSTRWTKTTFPMQYKIPHHCFCR